MRMSKSVTKASTDTRKSLAVKSNVNEEAVPRDISNDNDCGEGINDGDECVMPRKVLRHTIKAVD